MIGPLELLPQASVGSRGVFLSDLVTNRTGQIVPPVLLGASPAIGRTVFLSRLQVNELLERKAPELACTNWGGTERIRIVRAARVVNEPLLKEMLTSSLQKDEVKDRGELELRFTRPWANILVPDEPLSIKLVELPASGISSSFVCRFELIVGSETIGTYQQPVHATIWKEIYVAHSLLTRGQLLRDADVALEKRDILNNRDYLVTIPLDDPYLELRENVPAGTQLTSRQLRLRAIIKRGRQVDAMFQDDSLTIAVKAEALEDGVPGQIVRVRNLQSRREFKGKVQDEQTVLVMF
jgi:flagella basal body P-ring formation protein FlgA